MDKTNTTPQPCQLIARTGGDLLVLVRKEAQQQTEAERQQLHVELFWSISGYLWRKAAGR